MSALPRAFLARPIAHRALHDREQGRPENSRAAIRAAIQHGYGIEIDLQLSADGQAMVFHDDLLDRLTEAKGPVRAQPSSVLERIGLLGGDEGIPTFAEVLDIVAGQVPLLIELKDQDGQMGPKTGPLEEATLDALRGYEGQVALMSFNPHMAAWLRENAPERCIGLTTGAFVPFNWAPLAANVCAHLREIPDFDRVGADFISHEAADLGRDRVLALRAQGVPVLCWTIRSAEQELAARRLADNVTFEGYMA